MTQAELMGIKREKTGKATIDMPWLKYYSKKLLKLPLPETTAYKYLYENNKNHLDDIALEYYGRKYTYRQFFKKIDETARAYKKAGINEGDVATVSLPATPEAVFSLYALNKIGAAANMVSPTFTEEQIAEHISTTKSKVVVTLDKFYPKLKKAVDQANVEGGIKTVVSSPLDELPLGVKTIKNISDTVENTANSIQGKPKKHVKPNIEYNEDIIKWTDFIKEGKEFKGEIDTTYKEGTLAAIVYSSGSTGASKGIKLTNDSFNILAHLIKISGFNIVRGNRLMNIVPSFFSTGISVSLHLPLSVGVTTILEPDFNKDKFPKQIARAKPTYAIAPNSHWESLLNSKVKHLTSLEIPVSGGEATPVRVEELFNDFLAAQRSRFEWYHKAKSQLKIKLLKRKVQATLQERKIQPKLQKGYGMCEFGSGVTLTNDKVNKIGSVGIPYPHAVIGIFDENGNELNYGERGEIWVKSPHGMAGYYKRDDATKAFFTKDGFGKSGDIGYMDEDGFLFVLGRGNDFFIAPDGTKKYLFDIERVIAEDEAVQSCEAVALTIENGQKQIPVVHIILNPGYEDQEDEIIERIDNNCNMKLGSNEIPRGYKTQIKFPTTPGGKRDLEDLRKQRDRYKKPTPEGMLYLKFPESVESYSDYIDTEFATSLVLENKESLDENIEKVKKIGCL